MDIAQAGGTVPHRVGVIGGGRMGAGIAHVFARAGATVTVIEPEPAVAAARSRLDDGIAKAAKRDQGLDTQQLVGRLNVTSDRGQLADATLVVEAVPEDADLKAQMLTAVEQVVGDDAWLATNTSSLSITDLASKLEQPQRLVGLHFFNPVPPSALVEIVRTPHTEDELVELARGWVAALGKHAVVVRDSPGFASSRLGNALALEAMRMIEEEVATAQDIDAAMELGYRHATGPLRTSDLVGLDVRLGILEHLHRELGERFAPPQILRDMVARGELGRKTGKGFYTYDKD